MSVIRSRSHIVGTLLLVVFTWGHAEAVTPHHLSFEERVAASYVLEAYQQDSTHQQALIARATDFAMKAVQKGRVTVKVGNFEEFLKQFQGDWPDSGELATDLQEIEARPSRGLVSYVSDSPRIQRKIDAYIQQHSTLLSSAFPQAQNEYINKTGNVTETAAQARRQLEAYIAKRMKEFDSVGTQMVDQLNGLKDPEDRILLQTLFDEYFSNQSLDAKKQLLSNLLAKDLNASAEDKLDVMIQSSGPSFQKLLQIYTRQSDMPAPLKASFRKLEDSVRAVPWWQVQRLLDQEKDNFQFIYFERKPLGVGTMAQVHRAKIVVNGVRHDVVVRLIKPGMEQQIEEDHRILLKVADKLDHDPAFRATGAPQITPLIDDSTRTVKMELDQEATASRQMYGAQVYESKVLVNIDGYKTDLHIHVPQIFPPAHASKFMVQEMVIGHSLDKEALAYQSIMPHLKRVIVEEIAKDWIRELLFGSGFYHSDLHQGNFMVNVKEPEIEADILDYGMGGKVAPELRDQLLLLGAGIQLQREDLLAKAFWGISDPSQNKLTEADFTARVKARMQSFKKSGQPQDIDTWSGWASDQGIKLPFEFVSLNRGILILEKSLEDAGSSETFNGLVKKLSVENARQLYSIYVGKGLLTRTDLLKLGLSGMKSEPAKPVLDLTSQTAPAASGGLRCESLFN